MGYPVCRTPVSTPRSRAGDSSTTIVPVTGLCTPPEANPRVRRTPRVRRLGAKEWRVTKMEEMTIEVWKTRFRPMRSVTTPSAAMSIPATAKDRPKSQPMASRLTSNSCRIAGSA